MGSYGLLAFRNLGIKYHLKNTLQILSYAWGCWADMDLILVCKYYFSNSLYVNGYLIPLASSENPEVHNSASLRMFLSPIKSI